MIPWFNYSLQTDQDNTAENHFKKEQNVYSFLSARVLNLKSVYTLQAVEHLTVKHHNY